MIKNFEIERKIIEVIKECLKERGFEATERVEGYAFSYKARMNLRNYLRRFDLIIIPDEKTCKEVEDNEIYYGLEIKRVSARHPFKRSLYSTKYKEQEDLALEYSRNNGVDFPNWHSLQFLMEKHNLRPKDIGELLAADIDTVFSWLSPPDDQEHKKMPIPIWELLLLKLGEHPKLNLCKK